MKKFLYLCTFAMVMLLLSNDLYAQDTEYKTIFNTKEASLSGWGAFDIKAGQVLGDEIGMYMGGKGGLLINNTFTIGLAGYGLLPFHRLESVVNINNENPYLFFGYGGLYLEYIIKPMNAVHINANCIIGGGGAGYIYAVYRSNRYDGYDEYDYVTDPVFVIEPGINMGVNLTKWFRIDVGGSYRFVNVIEDYDIVSEDDLKGFSGNISFKFGLFK